MRWLPIILFLLPGISSAQPPPGYYDAAGGLSGPALRAALYEIINDHSFLQYSQLWQAFAVTDAKPNGTVWDMYSDIPGGTPAYSYQFVSNQCGTYDSEGDCFNREHSFPQSWFGGFLPMNTELFHLYPTDAWVNQKRGNFPYGTVSSPTWTGSNGSKVGPCTWPGCAGTAFEPIDAYKGDFARSYMYMMVRYMPDIAGWSTPMTTGDNFSPWAENLLLQWHAADPVSAKETNRNNAVYGLQGNRNPFIDNPQWAVALWGPLAAVEEADLNMARLWFDGTSLQVVLSDAGGTVSLDVFDISGRVVYNGVLRDRNSTLELSLPTGVFMAVARSGNQRSVLRFAR